MNYFLLFLLGFLAGVLGYWLAKGRRGKPTEQTDATKAVPGDAGLINPEQILEKERNLERVMNLARQQGEISNNNVEKLLGVSNATAERYLNELRQQGQLEQIGTTGQNIRYRPK